MTRKQETPAAAPIRPISGTAWLAFGLLAGVMALALGYDEMTAAGIGAASGLVCALAPLALSVVLLALGLALTLIGTALKRRGAR